MASRVPGLRDLWKRVTDKVAQVTGRAQTGQIAFVLDSSLPDDLRSQVFFLILYENDPAKVDAFALQLSSQGWPCAAHALRERSWRLRGKPPAQAPGPRPACGTGPAQSAAPGTPVEVAAMCSSIDPTLAGDDCKAFYAALTNASATSSDLQTYALSIAQAHPKASAALQVRATYLAQQEKAAAGVVAQVTGQGGPADDPPANQYTQPDLNQPMADAAIAESAALSPRIPSDGGAGQGAAYIPGQVRPRPPVPGGCVLVYRDVDHAWPQQIAKIGGGSRNQVGTLLRLNPHLMASDGQSMVRLAPGNELNVPCAWQPNLVAAGFKLTRD